MSKPRQLNSDFPIDFNYAASAEVKESLNAAGLNENIARVDTARRALQEHALARQLLLVLHRPISVGGPSHLIGGPDRHFFHPGYAAAALDNDKTVGLPSTPVRPGDAARWLQENREVLAEFAETDHAQEIIATSIAKYYRGIGRQVLTVQAFGDIPVIREYPDGGNIPALDYVGVKQRAVRASRMTDPSDRKKYLSMGELAEGIAWTIPGVKNDAVKDAIWEELGKDSSKYVMDPRAMFARGRIAVKGDPEPTTVPASEIFRVK